MTYLRLRAGPRGPAEDLVVVHHAVLGPQQRHGALGGVHGVQRPRRGRLWGNQIRDQIRNQIRDQIRNQIRDQIRNQIRDQIRNQIRDQIRNQIRDQIRNQIRDQIRDQIRNQIRDQIRDQISIRMRIPSDTQLPVKQPRVRQVDEELAVRPADEEHAVGVIHGGDVRRLRS
ncbi:Nipped-B-like protein B [Liparis tanakae]|uniref:Nipped-B-like protein B n=1 Tax=Liparis tanakae TaxID=230148 RepID=A0A4Z2EFQ9_9TELE|nr:Nipped-B-like protein B [Liparis tanakae]